MRGARPSLLAVVLALLLLQPLIPSSSAWMPDTDVNGDEPVSDSPATVQTAKGRSEDEPEPGKRYIVGLDSSAPRRDRAKASRDAKLLISQLGGTVRLESRIQRIPFLCSRRAIASRPSQLPAQHQAPKVSTHS
jgi:hypothetical protein